MPTNLKAVVAQCYRGWRSNGSRQFCSRTQSDGGSPVINRPEISLFPKAFDVLVPWMFAGYAFYFGWDMLYLNKVEREKRRDAEFDSKRRKEMAEKLREFGVSVN